jgi:hypothetical protein
MEYNMIYVKQLSQIVVRAKSSLILVYHMIHHCICCMICHMIFICHMLHH